MGAWLGGMVGMNVGNRRIKEFEDAIEAGELLVLVDVPVDRVEEIESRVIQHLPQVMIEVTELEITALP
jgi:hypothetical protein